MNEKNIKSKESVKNTRTSTKRRRKSKSNRKKIFLFAIFFLIVIVGIGYFLTTFNAFNIQDTIIKGTERYSKEELISKLGIINGNNIFMQMYFSSKADYSDLSYIEKIKISMASNNKIQLNVTERISEYIAYNKDNSKYYRLDKNGYILEECDPASKNENEVVILGISFDDVEVKIGSKISDIYLNKIDSYLNIKKEYENTSLKEYGNITKVGFDNSLTTITINDKLNVIIQDDNNLKYNMSLLQGIVGKLTEGSVGTIDMTKTNPVYSAY